MRYAVIMCGGVGSRMWPFSREVRPKQFLDFFGTGRSLLQMTVDRLRDIVPPERIILVTNVAYAAMVAEQLPDIPAANVLYEPARRKTASCVLWAARHIAAIDQDASIGVFPSDHLILREEEFRKALREGFDFVESGDYLLTLGIPPRGPVTAYGYLQRGHRVAAWPDVCRVKTFAEKPDRDMAELFISTGEFDWNSGIFLWSARSILKAYAECLPYLSTLFEEAAPAMGTPDEHEAVRKVYVQAESISADRGIVERARNLYVKTVDIGWSDLGGWKALYDASPKSMEGNVTQNCRVLTRDCEGSLFASSTDKVIVAGGLRDYIVADTTNALLICPLDREQEIRGTVNEVRNLMGSDYV